MLKCPKSHHFVDWETSILANISLNIQDYQNRAIKVDRKSIGPQIVNRCDALVFRQIVIPNYDFIDLQFVVLYNANTASLLRVVR